MLGLWAFNAFSMVGHTVRLGVIQLSAGQWSISI